MKSASSVSSAGSVRAASTDDPEKQIFEEEAHVSDWANKGAEQRAKCVDVRSKGNFWLPFRLAVIVVLVLPHTAESSSVTPNPTDLHKVTDDIAGNHRRQEVRGHLLHHRKRRRRLYQEG